MVYHPSKEQLIVTPGARVCGSCTPAGTPKDSSLPMNQGQKETSCVFSVGVYLGSPGLSFLKLLASAFFSVLWC